MKLIICNNTKENLSWEPEKMNVKFHNNCEKKRVNSEKLMFEM